MAAQTTTALSMKLFIDTKSQSVLFAEAGKDVVDFLFSLLDLPLATAVTLVGEAFVSSSAGKLSVDRRYASAFDKNVAAKDPSFSQYPAASLFLMPASSFEPSRIFYRCKHNYAGYGNHGIIIKNCCLYMTDVRGSLCPNCLNPMTSPRRHVSSASVDPPAWSTCPTPTFVFSRAAGAAADGSLLLKPPAPSSSEAPSRIFFRCVHQYTACQVRGGCNLYMADVRGTACPNCDNPMTETLYYVSPVWSSLSLSNATHKAQSTSGGAGGGGGSVQDQEAATYTVLDDLSIAPPNTPAAMSTVTRLGRMGITDLGAIQERTVRLGYSKGVQILKALLQSKTVLTDAFLCKVRA